jgi:hypothetical protein
VVSERALIRVGDGRLRVGERLALLDERNGGREDRVQPTQRKL